MRWLKERKINRLERKIAGLSAELEAIEAVLKSLQEAPAYMVDRLIDASKQKGECTEEFHQVVDSSLRSLMQHNDGRNER